MHEEQIGVVEEYTNVEHMKLVLEVLQKGHAYTEKYMIRQGEASSGDDSLDVSRRSTMLQDPQDESRGTGTEKMMATIDVNDGSTNFDDNSKIDHTFLIGS